MYLDVGFSEAAAASYVAMTAATIDGDFPAPDSVERGSTTLDAYIAALVRSAG